MAIDSKTRQVLRQLYTELAAWPVQRPAGLNVAMKNAGRLLEHEAPADPPCFRCGFPQSEHPDQVKGCSLFTADAAAMASQPPRFISNRPGTAAADNCEADAPLSQPLYELAKQVEQAIYYDANAMGREHEDSIDALRTNLIVWIYG